MRNSLLLLIASAVLLVILVAMNASATETAMQGTLVKKAALSKENDVVAVVESSHSSRSRSHHRSRSRHSRSRSHKSSRRTHKSRTHKSRTHKSRTHKSRTHKSRTSRRTHKSTRHSHKPTKSTTSTTSGRTSFTSFSSLFSSTTTKSSSRRPRPIILKPFDPRCTYLLFSGRFATSQPRAKATCKFLGGQLLAVTIQNVQFFSSQISEFAYVGSWNGDDYKPACIGLVPGNPIVVPRNGCKGPYDFICQICH